MDWFERIMGFCEVNYQHTRERLKVADGRLHSLVNGRSYVIGELGLESLAQLRERGSRIADRFPQGLPGRLRVSIVKGDVRRMHADPANRHALFQVASQFNLLEMIGPSVTPEQGVTLYEGDGTQGPACAIAAGAATIYRNYMVPVGAQFGQTHDCQLDGLAQMGEALASALQRPLASLWSMQNGYALCTSDGLAAISEYLSSLDEEERQRLRDQLRIGVHANVEVTDRRDETAGEPLLVSQAFCSALPVAYGTRSPYWHAFATLILEASYEATMWSALINAQQGGSRIVFLTRLGGGAFGNDATWIDQAMRRAFGLFKDCDLDVRLVAYGEPAPELQRLVRDFAQV